MHALLLGWLVSSLLFACAEALQVPLDVYRHRPALLPGAIAHAMALQLLYVPVALMLHATALVRAARWPNLGLGRSLLWYALPAALTSAEMIWVLSDNPLFLRQREALILVVSIAPALALAYALLGSAPRVPRWIGALFGNWMVGTACVVGALMVYRINYTTNPGRYPSYHLAHSQLALVLLQLGASHLALTLRGQRDSTRTLAGLCMVTLAFVVGLALLGAAPRARAFVAHHSLIGDAPTVLHPYQPWREDERARRLPDVADPAAEFRSRTHLPALPADFDLDDYNVLLVVSETTRHDQTSLPGARRDTTPSLAALASSPGSQTFTEAYSPSTGTLFSIASLMSMTYPSANRVRSWQRRWNGELDARTDTVAELFAREGRDTFWVGHNLRCNFDTRMAGFTQGFAHVERYPCDRPVSGSDAWIAATAVKRLRVLARTPERRFFGWVFLSDPHFPYRMPPGKPRASRMARYRAAIRHMDAQLGIVLRELRRSGLGKRTVVVFMGDHGEEFGEHGGGAHCTEVFGESAHVPLVVRVPGMIGAVNDGPVSAVHVLPWLMLHGGPGMRAAVEARLRREIVPMLRATDDAVVIELPGQDRMRSALRTRERSVHYDFIADLPRVYDLTRDPGELHDLYETEPEGLSADLARLEGYRTVRASTRRFGLDPERFVEAPAE